MTTHQVLDTLADVLARENAALQALDLPAAAALLPQKQAAIDALASGPAEPPKAAQGLRLRTLVTENQALLERAIRVQARVIEIVAGAYKPAAGTRTYGPSGEQTSSPLAGVAYSTRA
jgi:flagellar biosynthesis/type III secretory pathway chaperone